MSEAEMTAQHQKEQNEQVTTMPPLHPEIPTDGLCPPGDKECENLTPKPPRVSPEGFRSQQNQQYPTEWLALMGVASLAFCLLTLRYK